MTKSFGAIRPPRDESVVMARARAVRAAQATGDETDRLSALRARLSALVRSYQQDIDRFDQAVADRLGVNRTDMRCLDICLAEAEAGRRLTPKQLAVRSAMSPSAITTVLDRLERAGYVVRVRDTVNRRLVLITLTPAFAELAREIFAPVAAAGVAALAGYSAADLELLIEFFTHAHERRVEQSRALGAGADGQQDDDPEQAGR